MLFSHVKMSCFRVKAHLVFHWYLYNKNHYFAPATVTASQKEKQVKVIQEHFTLSCFLQISLIMFFFSCYAEVDYCFVQPCQNNGTCNNHHDNYTCICSIHFKGRNCEGSISILYFMICFILWTRYFSILFASELCKDCTPFYLFIFFNA